MVELYLWKKYLKNGRRSMVFKVYATEDFRNDVNEVCMYMETNF